MLIAVVIQHLALASAKLGDFSRSARLLGFADSRTALVDNATMHVENDGHTRLVQLLAGHFQADERAVLEMAGADYTEAAAIAVALAV